MATINPGMQQYLTNILSQRGPNSLPYEENSKWAIRQQITAAIQGFTNLTVSTSQFAHNDGRIVSLIQLEGTIPMTFMGVKYFIPIKMWLPEGFPLIAPLLFVHPTNNMVVKPNHSFVDPNGYINIPYLRGWMYPRSNLLELLQTCSKMFDSEPPLYTRSPVSNVAQSSTNSPRPPSGVNAASDPGQTMNPMRNSQGYPNQKSTTPMQKRDPDELFKEMAVNALVERLKVDISAHQKEASSQIENMFAAQKELIRKSEEMDNALRELHREKGILEQNLQMILTNTSVVEDWLHKNKKESTQTDPDTAFEPADWISKQALECTAADMAYEDLMYALDKAVQEDVNGDRVLPVDSYLRYTRNLSREQFFYKAKLLKLRGMQSHAQVMNLSARSPFAPGPK